MLKPLGLTGFAKQYRIRAICWAEAGFIGQPVAHCLGRLQHYHPLSVEASTWVRATCSAEAHDQPRVPVQTKWRICGAATTSCMTTEPATEVDTRESTHEHSVVGWTNPGGANHRLVICGHVGAERQEQRDAAPNDDPSSSRLRHGLSKPVARNQSFDVTRPPVSPRSVRGRQ